MKRLLLAALALVVVRALRKRPTTDTEPRPPWRGDYDDETVFLAALLVHETETHLRRVTQ